MRIENGKLVDYNYEDIRNIALDAVRRWTRKEHHDLVNTLVYEMQEVHRKEFRKRFLE